MQTPDEQKAIVQRMIEAGESEQNIATVIQHFKQVDTPKTTPFNPPRIAQPRGFLSAAKDIVSGIPGFVGSALEDTARMIVPNNAVLNERNMLRQSDMAQEFGKGVEQHGLPAEIVHHAGQSLGIPSHDIVQDYNDKNYAALAGDIAAPLALAKGMKAVAEVAPYAKEGLAQSRAARAVRGVDTAHANQASSIMRAVPPSTTTPYTMETVNRARRYLNEEHARAPITTVEAFVESADNAIKKIETTVAQYVAANPGDTIGTNPVGAARAALAKNPRSSAVDAGLKELSDLGLDKPVSVARAEVIREQLNAENKAFMKKNSYDRETARRADPAFAAREAAADSLRKGIYNRLELRGFKDARDLRLDEGALIQLRNAGQKQIFSGEKSVAGTGATSVPRQIAAQTLRLGSIGGGAVAAGPVGGVVGGVIGDQLARKVVRPNLTRDALIMKAFGVK